MRYWPFLLLIGLIGPAQASVPVDSTVSIEIMSEGTWTVIGTGVYTRIDGTVGILTAQHVAEDIKDSDMRACTFVGTQCVDLPDEYLHDGVEDWALFPIEKEPWLKLARVRHQKLEPGDSLTHIGMPWGQAWISTGNLVYQGEDFITANLNVAPGSSGGPMFDSAGRLVGIVTAHTVRPDRQVFDWPLSTYWQAIGYPILGIEL